MKIGINGVGVAGPTLAYWLKQYGHEPVLFEIAPKLRTGGYVIDFWGNGYDIAEKMGLIEELEKKAYFPNNMRVYGRKGQVKAEMTLDKMREYANGRFMSLPRGDLASAIYNKCEGIETHFGRSIVHVEQTADGVRTELSDGTTEMFDLIIGADGIHSQIRADVFGPESDFEVSQGLAVAAFYLEDYPHRDEETYAMHSEPKRQVMKFAVREGKSLMLFIFHESLVDVFPTNEAEEKALLRKVFAGMEWETAEILERMNDVHDVYFDRASQIHMDNWSKGRVALIGDAAAAVSLLAGEGTGLGMLEAYILAGELHKADGNHEIAFARYQELLMPHLKKKQKGLLKFVNFFAPSNRLWMWLRDMGIRFSSQRQFKKLLTKGNFDVPEYE